MSARLYKSPALSGTRHTPILRFLRFLRFPRIFQLASCNVPSLDSREEKTNARDIDKRSRSAEPNTQLLSRTQISIKIQSQADAQACFSTHPHDRKGPAPVQNHR